MTTSRDLNFIFTTINITIIVDHRWSLGTQAAQHHGWFEVAAVTLAKDCDENHDLAASKHCQRMDPEAWYWMSRMEWIINYGGIHEMHLLLLVIIGVVLHDVMLLGICQRCCIWLLLIIVASIVYWWRVVVCTVVDLVWSFIHNQCQVSLIIWHPIIIIVAGSSITFLAVLDPSRLSRGNYNYNLIGVVNCIFVFQCNNFFDSVAYCFYYYT
jgi:hypothetical protein